MAGHTRVLPDEIREGAQKPFRFLQKVGDVIVSLIMITIVVIFIVNWLSKKSDEYEKNKKLSLLSTETKTESSYGQMQQTTNVKSVKIVAYPGIHTKKTVPYGYDWMLTRDSSYGFVNANKPMWVSVNDGTPQKDIGSQSINVFPKGAEFIKFIPDGEDPIYLVYSLMKRK